MTSALIHRTRAIELDDSRLPLVIVTFRGVATVEEFDRYLDAQTRILDRREKTVVVVDAMAAGHTPPLQRKKVVEWMSRYDHLLRVYALGTSFAFDSPLVRGALTAILWMQPLSHPHHIAASRADAERWAIARIAACGLEVPRSTRPPTLRPDLE